MERLNITPRASNEQGEQNDPYKLGRRALGALFAGGILGLAASGCKSEDSPCGSGDKCCGKNCDKDGKDDKKTKDTKDTPLTLLDSLRSEEKEALETLQKILDYLGKDKEEFTHFASLATNQPRNAKEKLKIINGKLEELKKALIILENSGIKLHPQIFHATTAVIHQRLAESNVGDRNRLTSLKEFDSRNRGGKGLRNRFVKWVGGEVARRHKLNYGYLSLHNIRNAVKSNFREITQLMAQISDHTIKGYSNNDVIDRFCEKKRGSERPTSRTPRNFDMNKNKKGTVMRLMQEFLIDNGCLSAGQNDGNYGRGTQNAIDAYQTDGCKK